MYNTSKNMNDQNQKITNPYLETALHFTAS